MWTNATYKNDDDVDGGAEEHLRREGGEGTPSRRSIDAVDCTGDTCTVDDIVATLTVNFPGISSVHTYVKINDGVADSFTGGDVDQPHLQEQRRHR